MYASARLAARAARLTSPRLTMSMKLSEDETLQVIRLGHPEQDRMVAALHPFLDDGDVRLSVDARLVHDLGERRLVDVVRAAAGDERAAGIQQLQGAEVDLLVARRGVGNRGLVFRDRRRFEHDRV